MALYAFDGTWNTAKDSEDQQAKNTNVFRFYEAYHKNSKNPHDLYVPGVGTRFDLIGKIAGGFFGMGELPRINAAYDHLCTAWADGDHTIDVIGFSRGAATTLDFCHRIQDGIRRPGSDDVVERNPTIRFLGVWDVVAAFGLANLGNTALNIGHHLSVPKANLQYCFHALALDERRPSFLPTRLNGACEVWFRGVHSDVGGGNTNKGLNDIALKWMMSKAKAAGLPIADEDIAALKPDPATLPHGDHTLLKVRVISAVDRRHYTVSPLPDWATPPPTCPVETQADERSASELGAALEVLSAEDRDRVEALWATAQATAGSLDFPIDTVKDALVTLFQGRLLLITNDDQLHTARRAVATLVTAMVHGAQQRGFHVMNEFFLTEALFNLHPLPPLTD